MDNKFREKQQRNYEVMRKARDISMAILILIIGLIMIFADKIGIEFQVDSTIRYLFGGLCLLYGSFRFYRGISKDQIR